MRPHTLWRIEAGKSEPSVDAIKRLAETLGVTTDKLIFDSSEAVDPAAPGDAA